MSLPSGKIFIESKWIYKIKYKSDGTIERYKTHLIAKGYIQIEIIDYHEIFASVVKLVTTHCLLTVASIRGWLLYQLNVNNIFLHGDLHEDVYMRLPPDLARQGEHRVCKLHKALYCLKQASQN